MIINQGYDAATQWHVCNGTVGDATAHVISRPEGGRHQVFVTLRGHSFETHLDKPVSAITEEEFDQLLKVSR